MDEYIENIIAVCDGMDTDFGYMKVIDGDYMGEHMRLLMVDGAMQSAVYLDPAMSGELPFEYMQEFDWVYRIHPGIRNALLIGGGAFAYPRYYLHRFPENRMTVCEISPQVVQLAKEYFGLDELVKEAGDRMEIVIKDGKSFMEESEQLFDLILNDAYIGGRSSESMKEQAKLIHRHLSENGVYAANMVIALEGEESETVKTELESFAEEFRYTFLMPCDDELDPTDEQNCIFFASDHPLISEMES